MAAKSSIKVNYNHIPDITVKLGSNSTKITESYVTMIRDSAKTIVPVDTGELRDSIQILKIGDKKWSIVATADHALPVELGTVNTPAQPYMQPAAAMHREAFFDSMKKVLD